MFGTMTRGAAAYANVGVETGVTAATPHKLIVMLFDGALIAVANAQQHMKAGNVAEKGAAISKAITIIESGLRASLNMKAGGDIAVSLDALYEYMNNRLFEANLKNQPALLDEVQGLLADLKGAWEAIAPASESASPSPAAAPAMQDPLAPRPISLVKA
ncbi:MAG: flagellar export chaperone FliS [Burkholderiaceae bacterium]